MFISEPSAIFPLYYIDRLRSPVYHPGRNFFYCDRPNTLGCRQGIECESAPRAPGGIPASGLDSRQGIRCERRAADSRVTSAGGCPTVGKRSREGGSRPRAQLTMGPPAARWWTPTRHQSGRWTEAAVCGRQVRRSRPGSGRAFLCTWVEDGLGLDSLRLR